MVLSESIDDGGEEQGSSDVEGEGGSDDGDGGVDARGDENER
jgi:hypothetical protein